MVRFHPSPLPPLPDPTEPPDPSEPLEPRPLPAPAAVPAPTRAPAPQSAVTDFTRYSHPDLVAMLTSAEPDRLGLAIEVWGDLGRLLYERAGDLRAGLKEFDLLWSGTAAERYQVMILSLADGITRLADLTVAVRDLLSAAVDALRVAAAQLPPPGGEPARRRAVQVLSWLAAGYRRAHAELADSIAALDVPPAGPADGGKAWFADLHASGLYSASQAIAGRIGTAAIPPAVPFQPPYGPVPYPPGPPYGPYVPASPDGPPGQSPLGPPPSPPPLDPFVPSEVDMPEGPDVDLTPGPELDTAEFDPPSGIDLAASTAGFEPPPVDTGGIGGIGGGIGDSAGVTTDTEPPARTAHPGLAGGAGAAAVAGGAAFARGAGAAGAAGGRFGMVPPMMPMGMMGAGAGADAATGRRIPAWLVETEDLWGDPTVVTPPVIGEDP